MQVTVKDRSLDEVYNLPWESEAQRKGFYSLVQYLKRNGFALDSQLAAVAAYFIQKDHESSEWWSNTVGDQISRLQKDFLLFKEQVEKTRQELNEHIAAVNASLIALSRK